MRFAASLLCLVALACTRGSERARPPVARAAKPAVSTSAPMPLRVSDDMTAPVAIHRVEPDLAGCPTAPFLIVKCVITKAGDVTDVRLEKPPQETCAANRVLAAVRQWKFRPATYKGQPVAVEYALTVNIHYR